MKTAVQLYTLRDILKKETMRDILRQIAKLGYAGVEFAGFYGIEAEDMKAILEECSLVVCASHTPLEKLEEDFSTVVEYNRALGNPHIVIPWTNINPDNYDSVVVKIQQFVKILDALGFTVHYHNHAHEFVKKNGKFLLDCLLEDVPQLWLEFDIHWAFRAGVDPLDYMKKHASKMKLIHLKDLKTIEGIVDFAPLGEGELALGDILKECALMEWGIVENDAPRKGSLKDISISASYLKEKGVM